MKTIIFESPQYGELRVGADKGTVLFCIKDICKSLKLNEASAIDRLSDNDIFEEFPPLSLSSNSREYTNLDGLIEIANIPDYTIGKKYRKWIITDVLPKAGAMLQSERETISFAEVMQCLKDVIIDYPICAIESNDSDMDMVHHNISILTKFYYSMIGAPSSFDHLRFSPICK